VQDARASGRLAHAFLVAGPAGVGKRTFARALGASLLCESPQPDGIACGSCRGCTQYAAGTHPNLLWITREINERTGKEKRDISMDQLRGLMERLSLSSHYGQAWVVVVDPADALNVNGVNALLKTIEEPPPGCHVLLLSERPMELAPTLRSRCQLLRFPLPPRDAALAWLRETDPQLDPAALDLAGGAPLRALEDRESGLSGRVREWRRQLLELARLRLDPVAAAAAAKLDKDSIAPWLRTLVGLLHDLLRARSGLDTDPAVAEVATRLTPGDVELLLAEAVAGHRRLQSNAAPQLLGESLMIALWARARTGTAPTSRNRA
jgi:DNA polymerase-3 subunit delta'